MPFLKKNENICIYYRVVGDSENLGGQLVLELVVDKQTLGLTYKGPASEQTRFWSENQTFHEKI